MPHRQRYTTDRVSSIFPLGHTISKSPPLIMYDPSAVGTIRTFPATESSVSIAIVSAGDEKNLKARTAGRPEQNAQRS